MFMEESPKLSRPNPESRAQRVDVRVVEHAIFDQAQGTGDGIRASPNIFGLKNGHQGDKQCKPFSAISLALFRRVVSAWDFPVV